MDYRVKINGQWRATKTASKQLEGNEEGKCKVKLIREKNHPGFQISPWGDGLCAIARNRISLPEDRLKERSTSSIFFFLNVTAFSFIR